MKPTAQKIAQYRAISTRKAAAAANDQGEAPKAKGTLKLADFAATVEFNDVKVADDANGNPYYAFKGATVRVGEVESVRTVMAFESYDLVRKVVLAGQPLVAMLANAGSTLKIVGVMVDGEMVLVQRDARIAA